MTGKQTIRKHTHTFPLFPIFLRFEATTSSVSLGRGTWNELEVDAWRIIHTLIDHHTYNLLDSSDEIGEGAQSVEDYPSPNLSQRDLSHRNVRQRMLAGELSGQQCSPGWGSLRACG